MKALIRKQGETLIENVNVPCIDWNTGHPLTDPGWSGGPYTLVQNYVPPVDDDTDQYVDHVPQKVNVPQEEDVVEDDDYVVIGGVRYSKEELRSLIE